MMALGAFGGVLHNGFVYDDLLIIYANPLFSNQPNLTAIFSSDYFCRLTRLCDVVHCSG